MNNLQINSPYQLNKKDKETEILEMLTKLHQHHYKNCSKYKLMIDKLPFTQEYKKITDFPYLPVGLFKLLELYSVPEEEIIKTLTSSGTTSQQVSKIFLDKETSMNQSRALIQIVSDWIGKKRLPMLIIDHRNVLKNRQSFSARGAGIVGFSQFGRDHFYLLNDNMEADWEGLERFLMKHQDEQLLVFGFTFMIWQYLYQPAVTNNRQIDLSEAILIHGGGWKKLLDESVDNQTFKKALKNQFAIEKVHNYYGMVEQVGSIFMECENGYLHTPDYADIIIRNTKTLQPTPNGQEGIIQVLSTLPKSYPGNSILTEDLGIIVGEDDCPCSRKGKYFHVIGRLPSAELRGCSDTFAYGSEEETL